MSPFELLKKQKIVSTKNFLTQFSSLRKNTNTRSSEYYHVVKNGEAVGVFLPQSIWEKLVTDLEELSNFHSKEERKIKELYELEKDINVIEYTDKNEEGIIFPDGVDPQKLIDIMKKMDE